MVVFTQAASGDACMQRLTEIEQGLAQGKRIDTSLTQSNKNIIFDFWSKYVVRPLYYLIGWEYSAAFRAKNVAASILNFCQANHEYVKAQPDIAQKAISIINTLDAKTKLKYHADIEAKKTELAKLNAPAQNPDPQPAPAATTNTPASSTDGSVAQKPQAEVPPSATTNAPTQATGDAAATQPKTVDAPSDKPATEVAKDTNAVASNVLGTPVSAKQPTEAKTPASAKGKAADVKAPVAPPVNLERMSSLSEQDAARIDAKLQAATAQLGYNTMLQLINNNAKSVCLSPVALMEMMEVLAIGMTDEKNQKALRSKLQLNRLNENGIVPRLVALRETLKEQGIDLLTAVLARGKFDDKDDEEYVQMIKDFGIPVLEPIQRPYQTVRAQFVSYVKEMLKHDGSIPEIMHNDWSKKELGPQLGYNISTVANVQPQVAIKPISEAKDQDFTFSNNQKEKVDLYTFDNVNAIETDDFSMALLPYKTEDDQPTLYKLIFVPKKDFKEFAGKIAPGFVAKCLKQLEAKGEAVQLEMPKTDIQVRERKLLDLYTSEKSSHDVQLPVEELVGYETTSLMQNVYFTERFDDVAAKVEEKKDEAQAPADAAAAPAQAPKTLKVNKSFYYLVMSDDNVVLQGRVDSKEGLSHKFLATDV